MSILGQALIIGLIEVFDGLNYALGSSQFDRPIVVGPLVGLALGNLREGIIIGATLELFFIGAISIGAFEPPDAGMAGVLATAFAISAGKGTAAALALALPFAMLSMGLTDVHEAVVVPMLAKVADKYAAKGNSRGINFVHFLSGGITVSVNGILAFLAFWLGNDKLQPLLDMIPDVVSNGLSIAAGILPAIGFAMLAQMIINKKVAPFFFLGFVLSAYLKVPVIGVAVLGLILVIAWARLKPSTNGIGKEVPEDDDF